MNQKNVILQGAFILTLAGFASRIIGFFYRIFLSHTIGAEGVGIYQLIFPIYAMAFSLTSSGIQTAISRNVSGKMATGDRRGAKDVFLAGLILTCLGTFLVSIFLYRESAFISSQFLQESRCQPLVQLLAYALPFAGVHSCINGYYFGLKKTNIPAISQMVEQIARVSSAYLVYMILLERGMAVTPLLAAIGLVCEEVVSSLFSVSAAVIHFRKQRIGGKLISLAAPIRNILNLSVPLTANRVLINLLQSVEAVCIPLRLQLSGLSTASALSVYGVLTGMALPLVLFPSAITSAISVMLLPTVSEAQASGKHSRIAKTIEGTVQYSLILGIMCTGLFLCFGNDLGRVLFNSPLAGNFIMSLAWICPFLYLGSTLSSILNGLGKAMTSFWQNTIALVIRILFVWFLIPRFGITAYLWGLLVSQLLTAFMALFVLSRYVEFRFDSVQWLLKPILALALGIGVMLFFRSLVNFLNLNILPLMEILISVLLLCFIYVGIMFFSPIYILLIKKGILKE